MASETPRGVSSRLLTMKFMQRAAASSSATGSPDSDTHSTKKRKLGHASPSESRFNANIDQASIKAALDEQEAKRQAALEQHSTTDTHWVLKNNWSDTQGNKAAEAPLKVVYVGYGGIDSSNESGDDEDEPQQGRTSTRNYKKSSPKVSTATTSQNISSADEENDQDSDDSQEPTPGRKRKTSSDGPHTDVARSRSRSRSHSRNLAESSKAKEFRDKRKKKEVRLNQLSSISSAGDGQFGSSGGKPMTCYKCHQPGHRAVDCPRSGGVHSKR